MLAATLKLLAAFQLKYSDSLPPSWMLLEIASFGSLSMLYKNLKPGRDKRVIATFFGLDDKTLGSWLHGIVYLRNVCAHHSRLWNRELSIQPGLPMTPKKTWLAASVKNNRVYFALSMILFFLETVNPNHNLLQKIFMLFQQYTEVDRKAMGFEAGWEQEKLWQSRNR